MSSSLKVSSGGNYVTFENVRYNLENAACLVASKKTYFISSEFLSITCKRIKNVLFGDGVWYTNQRIELLIEAIPSKTTKKNRDIQSILPKIAEIKSRLNEQPQETLFPLLVSTSIANADLASTNLLWYYCDFIWNMNFPIETPSVLYPAIREFQKINSSILRFLSHSENITTCLTSPFLEEVEFRSLQSMLERMSKKLLKNTPYEKYTDHFLTKSSRALIISSLFAAVHPAEYGILGLVTRFKSGLVLAAIHEKYHSVLLTIFSHVLLNTLLTIQAEQGNWEEEIKFFLNFDILA